MEAGRIKGAQVSSMSSWSGEAGSRVGWVGVGWMREEEVLALSSERGSVVVVVVALGRRVSGYSLSKRSIMRSRVVSRKRRRPGKTCQYCVL